MADLLTHACTALLWRGGRPMGATFLYGTLLPDILARFPPMVLAKVDEHLIPLPKTVIYGWDPLHIPAGMVLVSLLLAQAYAQPVRARAFGWLLGGMFLHLAVDLLQYHQGAGYLLFWPLSNWDFELGWISSEATVVVAPFLAVLTLFVLAWRYRHDRGAVSPTPAT